jgi:RNA polymerase sigma factor (sigma-70 family)
MSDEQGSLGQLIRTGSPESIARAAYPVVRRMAASVLRGGDEALVETAAHDALLAICRYRAGFRGDSKATTWIYPIVRRAAGRAARRWSAHEVVDPVLAAGADPSPPAAPDPLARRAARAELCRAVPNAEWRRVWLLHHEPGAHRTHEEIARLTGYTPGSVAVTLSRVKRRIEAWENAVQIA